MSVQKIIINDKFYSIVDSKFISNETIFTKLEQKALIALVEKNQKLTSKKQFTEEVWGHLNISDSSLRKLISSLRKKLGDKEGNILVTERGFGYYLVFESVAEVPFHISKKGYRFILTTLITVTFSLALIYLTIKLSAVDQEEPKFTNFETIFQYSGSILTYTKHEENYFILAEDVFSNKSLIYKVIGTKKDVVYEPSRATDYLLDFSISPGGKSLIHVNSNERCEVVIFNKIFEQIHSRIPCSRYSPDYHYEWISEEQILFTYKPQEDIAARPYIYDLKSKKVVKLNNLGIDYDFKDNSEDIFVKQYKDGIITVRLTDSFQFTAYYFTDKESFRLFENFSSRAFAIKNDHLYLIDDNNQVMFANLTNYRQGLAFSKFIGSSPLPSFFPQFEEGELHFINGTMHNLSLYKASTNDEAISANGLWALANGKEELVGLFANDLGYEIRTIAGKVKEPLIINTELAFDALEKFNDIYLLGGKKGLYKFEGGHLIKLSDKPISNIVNFGQPIIESEGQLIRLIDYEKFDVIAHGITDLTKSKSGYFYIEKLNGNILNHNGEIIAKNYGSQKLLSIDDKVVYGQRNTNGGIDFFDVVSKAKTFSIKYPLLNFIIYQYKGETYYVSSSKSHNSLIKVSGSAI